MAESEPRDFHLDYDLEDVFHRQLKILDLDANVTRNSDTVGDHLPEWLIGVIIVVIMLIIAFFAMIVTSIQKKKNISQGEISRKPCDDLESGAISVEDNGETLQVTSFIYNNDAVTPGNNSESTMSGCPTLNSSEASKATERGELKSYTNPLFIEDDEDAGLQKLSGTYIASEYGHISDPNDTELKIKHSDSSHFCNEQTKMSSLNDNHNVVIDEKSKQPVETKRRFSQPIGTKKEILTEAVVENSFNLDHKTSGKQRRKYLQKIKVSNQAHGVKRGRSKSESLAQNLSHEKDSEPEVDAARPSVVETVQNCQSNENNQLNPTLCCSDSDVDISTKSELVQDELGDKKHPNVVGIPKVHQRQIGDRETDEERSEEVDFSNIFQDEILTNHTETKTMGAEESLTASDDRSLQPFTIAMTSSTEGDLSLSKLPNGTASPRKSEGSDESENSSTSSISLSTLCALRVSDHPEKDSVPHCTREQCRDDKEEFKENGELGMCDYDNGLAQTYNEINKAVECPSSALSGNGDKHTCHHTINHSQELSSLSSKSNGTKDPKCDLTENFSDPRFSTNL